MKYKIVLLSSFGLDVVEYYDSWLYCKLRMLWLNITGKSAVWMEKVN